MNDWQISVSPQKKRRNADEDSLASTVVGNSVKQRPLKPPDPPDPFLTLITASHTRPISAPVHVTLCNNIISQSVMTEELENLGSEEVKTRFGGRRGRHVHPKDPTSVRTREIRTHSNTSNPSPGNVAELYSGITRNTLPSDVVGLPKSNVPEGNLPHVGPVALASAILPNTLSPSTPPGTPLTRKVSDPNVKIISCYRSTRERVGRHDLERITSHVALKQVEALEDPDANPDSLVVLDNRIAGACIELYVPPAAEDNVVKWISLMGKSPVAEDTDSSIEYTPLREGETLPHRPVCGWLPSRFWPLRQSLPKLLALGSGNFISAADIGVYRPARKVTGPGFLFWVTLTEEALSWVARRGDVMPVAGFNCSIRCALNHYLPTQGELDAKMAAHQNQVEAEIATAHLASVTIDKQ